MHARMHVFSEGVFNVSSQEYIYLLHSSINPNIQPFLRPCASCSSTTWTSSSSFSFSCNSSSFFLFYPSPLPTPPTVPSPSTLSWFRPLDKPERQLGILSSVSVGCEVPFFWSSFRWSETQERLHCRSVSRLNDMHMHTHTTHTHTHIYMHVYTGRCNPITHTHTHTHAYIYIYIYIYMCVCVCVYIYIYMCVCVYQVVDFIN